MSAEVTLIVIAKEPVPGRVKTRLRPAFTSLEAAAIAAAAIADTLATVASVPAPRRLLALDGRSGRWLPPGFEVVPQREGGLGERLAGAFAEARGPSLLLGMDTPQLTPGQLQDATAALLRPGVDAVLGPAEDGGFWAVGMRRPRTDAFDGVPMSTGGTGLAQRRRLEELGMRVAELPALRDVDTYADARAVADACPGSRFAAAFAELQPMPARAR